MDWEALQAQIDELMRRYHDGAIDGQTYARKTMEPTGSAQGTAARFGDN